MNIFQNWIIKGTKRLSGVTHWSAKRPPKAGVLLLAGFSQAKCDLNYMMSQLACKLCEQGFMVLQLDPVGHGDSSGDLQDVTLATLKEDLQDGIAYIKRQYSGKVYGVGRGLAGVLMGEYLLDEQLAGVVAINPYLLNGSMVASIFPEVDGRTYELAEVLREKDADLKQLRNAFFHALGADFCNLKGQQLSGKFLLELMEYDPESVWKQQRTHKWKTINTTDNVLDDGTNPLLLYQMMEDVCQWIHNQTEEAEI